MIFVVAACVPVKVKTEAAEAVDFERYATFVHSPASSDAEALPESSDAMRNRVRGAIAASLTEKGYRRVDDEEAADLLVAFAIEAESTRRLVNAADPDTDFVVPRDFEEGTLTVLISDRRDGREVWRGVGETSTPTSGALLKDDPERALIESARKVLREFPARPSSGS